MTGTRMRVLSRWTVSGQYRKHHPRQYLPPYSARLIPIGNVDQDRDNIETICSPIAPAIIRIRIRFEGGLRYQPDIGVSRPPIATPILRSTVIGNVHVGSARKRGSAAAVPHDEESVPQSQKPKDSPVLNENFERSAGPANSVPTPTSQTTRGVSWYRRPTSVPTVVGSP